MQIMIGRPGQTRPLVKEMEKEKEKEETIWRKKIFGKRRTRWTEKEKEENILEKKNDDGQTDIHTDEQNLFL